MTLTTVIVDTTVMTLTIDFPDLYPTGDDEVSTDTDLDIRYRLRDKMDIQVGIVRELFFR